MKKLKNDMKNNSLEKMYIFFGEEDYMKSHYINLFKANILENNDFNELILDEETFCIQEIDNFINSYPVMNDKKLLIIKDIDIFSFIEDELNIFSDLPDYINVIFLFQNIEYKQDKRKNSYKFFAKNAEIIDFKYLLENELIKWIQNTVKTLDCKISIDVSQYLIWCCSKSMINLLNEINKLCSIPKEISKNDIDKICHKVLSAVVFDISDYIADGAFEKAINLSTELILLKSQPIAILASFARNLEKLYITKLAQNQEESYIMDVLNTKSSFYVRKMLATSKKLGTRFLQESVLLCMYADYSMKHDTFLKEDTLRDLLLNMAVLYNEN